MNDHESQRIMSIDAIKAFAILCMVFGHCIQYGSGNSYYVNNLYFDNWIFRVIYSFHMPLFMLVSGFLFGRSIPKTPWYSTIVRKVKTLVVPILFWSLLSLSLFFVLDLHNHSVFSAGHYIIKYVSTFLTSLWFLWAIFWCSLSVTLVNRFFNDNVFIYFLGLVLTFFIPDVYNLSLYKYMYPFFIIGYLFNKGKILSVDYLKSWILLCSALTLFIVLVLFYNNDSYIYITGYKLIKGGLFNMHQLIIDIYRFLVGLAGSVFFIALFQVNSLYKSVRLNRILSYVGSNTLGIYIISGYLFIFVPKLTSGFQSFNIFASIIECVIVLFLSLLINGVIKKSTILRPLLLGKQ